MLGTHTPKHSRHILSGLTTHGECLLPCNISITFPSRHNIYMPTHQRTRYIYITSRNNSHGIITRCLIVWGIVTAMDEMLGILGVFVKGLLKGLSPFLKFPLSRGPCTPRLKVVIMRYAWRIMALLKPHLYDPACSFSQRMTSHQSHSSFYRVP